MMTIQCITLNRNVLNKANKRKIFNKTINSCIFVIEFLKTMNS